MKSLTLTAIDIGTTSIKGLISRKDFRTGDIDVLARTERPCFGVRNGEVVKPDQVAKTLLQVKEELTDKAHFKIKEVLVNINGSHLFSMKSEGLISVSRADGRVSKEDVERVIRMAQTINLPSNKEVLEVFPQEFVVDGEKGVKEPVGLQGNRLETKVLLICVFSPILDNLEDALHEAGLQVLTVVPSFLASSRAVLSEEQKELGVLLVELGAGTTSVAVFEKGDLIDFAVFPVGSANITNDIAIGLRTDIQTAEKIKQDFATLKPGLKKGKKDRIEIPDKSLCLSVKFLNKIVESRVSEIFGEIQRSLKKISGGQPLPSGIVFTGGGANLPGLADFAKQRFKLPCHIASFRAVKGVEEPQFSTCLGLLLKGLNKEEMDIERPREQNIKEKLKRVFKAFLP